MRWRAYAIAGVLLWLAASACRQPSGTSWLGPADEVAPGVEFYRTTDDSLVEGAGPIAVFLLKLDPARAFLASALSNERVLEAELVTDIATRHAALAAVNGGFFNRANGEPIGVLKVAGELVSDASLARGAVAIFTPPDEAMMLRFDRLAAKVRMMVRTRDERWSVPVDGVDTTRERGRLMLYTPAYRPHTDTAPTGTEWVLDGEPLRVVSIHRASGRTPIPPRGAVLSYGGLKPPDELNAIEIGDEIEFETLWRSAYGIDGVELDRARHIVNGAGLLRRGGVTVPDWKDEGLGQETFVDARHPRTVIGLDATGAVWLIVADGRQPTYSIGMRFADLQRLADRLALTDALNLDGGGSTTMVVQGKIVNRPSDPGGARPVADAVVVVPRERAVAIEERPAP